MQKNKFLNTQTISTMALFIALQIILSRFLSISTYNVKIGFSFVPIFMCAILLGPVKTGIVGALADIIGANLFPIGTYFPGFTFTSFLMGVTWGIFVHKKQKFPQLAMAILVNQLLFSLVLNTIWIHILYGSPIKALLITRITQVLVMILVEFVVTLSMVKYLKPYAMKFQA
ncbi:MAG: folate family ECF transporter S component [Eubacteriales bacterium]